MSAICSVAFGAAVAAGLADDSLSGFGVGLWLATVLLFVLDPFHKWLVPRESVQTRMRYSVVEIATIAFIVASFLPDTLVDGALRTGAVVAVGICNYPVT
jgi:hypothetical protein